jgi:dolichol-phosphate mannosyltransferase
MSVELSIIVAVYNEVPRNLLTLLERLHSAIEPTKLSYEVIFVNDGSGAKTSQALRQIATEVDYVKLVILSRNFGQQAAISAGLAEASGHAVVNIDSDLQDPPELIPQMVELWRQGYDVVYAKRSTRRDRLAKRLSAHLFYRLLGSMSSVDIPWDTGDFRLLDRKVVAALNALPEKTRFLRGMIPWLGFKQTGIAIDRDAREFGESTYTLKKLLQLACDGLLSFSSQPLYLIPMVGGACLVLGVVVLLAWVIVAQGGANHADVSFWQGLLIPLVVALSGLQILATGFVAVYLSKVLDEVRARPTYVVAERLGLPYATDDGERSPKIKEEKRREDASGNPGQQIR